MMIALSTIVLLVLLAICAVPGPSEIEASPILISWKALGAATASVLQAYPMKIRKEAYNLQTCFPESFESLGYGFNSFLTGFSSSGSQATSIWFGAECIDNVATLTYKDGATYILVGNIKDLRNYVTIVKMLVLENVINISKTLWLMISTEPVDMIQMRNLQKDIPEKLRVLLLRMKAQQKPTETWKTAEGLAKQRDDWKILQSKYYKLIPNLGLHDDCINEYGFKNGNRMWNMNAKDNKTFQENDYKQLSSKPLHLKCVLPARQNKKYVTEQKQLGPIDINPTVQSRTKVDVYVAVSLVNGSVIFDRAANWKDNEGLIIRRPLYRKPIYSFKKRTITLTTVHKPRVFQIKRKNGSYVESLDEVDGYVAEVIRILQQHLNLTVNLRFTNTFGTKLDNGSWNGMIGDLTRKRADLSPLDFSPSWARAQAIDFSEWFSTDGVIVISQAALPISKPFLMLEIFSIWVWLAILGTGVTTGVLLWTIDNILKGSVTSLDKDPTNSLMKMIESAMKLFLIQGSKNWPTTLSGRCLSACFFLVVISVVALYQGYIIAFLTVPRRASPIDSAHDLMDRLDKVTPIVRKNTVYYRFVVNFESFSPIARNLRFHQDSFLNTWEFFELIQNGMYALIDTYSSGVGRAAAFESRGKQCRFHVSKSVLKNDVDQMVHPQNSVFREQIDHKIRQLRSFGIIENIKKRYYSASCEGDSRQREQLALSLSQLQSAFYVLLAGLLVSFVGFVFEILQSILMRMFSTA